MLVKRFFNTPDQRYEIKDLLIKIYEIMFQTGLALRLFEFLDPNWLASVSSNEIAAFKYKVQWYALEILTAYVNGPGSPTAHPTPSGTRTGWSARSRCCSSTAASPPTSSSSASSSTCSSPPATR